MSNLTITAAATLVEAVMASFYDEAMSLVGEEWGADPETSDDHEVVDERFEERFICAFGGNNLQEAQINLIAEILLASEEERREILAPYGVTLETEQEQEQEQSQKRDSFGIHPLFADRFGGE